MKKGIIVLLTMFAVYSFFLSTSSLEAAEEFKIGVTLPLSGTASTYGIPQLDEMQMAVEEINSKGGVTVAGKKYTLTLVVYDDKCTPAEGVSVLEKLISRDKVKIILGPVCSNVITASAPKIVDRVIIMTTGTVTSGYTELGNPNIFRPHTSCIATTQGAIDFMTQDLGVRNLGFLAAKIQFSYEMMPMLEKVFKKEGSKFSVDYVDLNATNAYPQLTSLGGNQPDAIFYAGYPDQGALMLKQMHELGIKPKHRLTWTSGTTAQFLAVTSADILEGFYDVAASDINVLIELKNPKAIAFDKKFRDKFGVAPTSPGGMKSYDVVYMVAKALEKAGSTTDLVKIRTALQNMGRFDEMILDYPTVNGKIFNAKNEVYFGAAIRQFRNGAMRLVKLTKPVGL
jgi:branched-chain amino acid transport system substrate-binding protein